MSGRDASDVPGLADLRAGGGRRQAWRKYWIRDPLNGAVDNLLYAATPLLGVDGASAFGAAMTRRTIPFHHADWVERADLALARLRPDLDAADRAGLLDRRHAAIGRTMMELPLLHRLIARDRFAVDGAERLRDVLSHDGAVILAAIHLGNWEASAMPPLLHRLSGKRGAQRPVHAIYQPPRSRFRHRLAVHARERCGVKLLPPGRAGGPAAMRALRDRGVVWLAIDDFRDRQVHGPLFGRQPTRRGNLAAAVRLAAATDARVLPLYVVREGGAEFTLKVAPEPDDWPSRLAEARAGDIAPAVAALNARLEPPVRAHLDQWFMLHELRLPT